MQRPETTLSHLGLAPALSLEKSSLCSQPSPNCRILVYVLHLSLKGLPLALVLGPQLRSPYRSMSSISEFSLKTVETYLCEIYLQYIGTGFRYIFVKYNRQYIGTGCTRSADKFSKVSSTSARAVQLRYYLKVLQTCLRALFVDTTVGWVAEAIKSIQLFSDATC